MYLRQMTALSQVGEARLGIDFRKQHSRCLPRLFSLLQGYLAARSQACRTFCRFEYVLLENCLQISVW